MEQILYSASKNNLDLKLILKLKRIPFVLGAALFCGGQAFSVLASEPRIIDEALIDVLPEKALPQLQEILEKAMRNAPRLTIAGFDLEQAGVNVRMARAPMLPSISGGYNFGGVREERYTAIAHAAASTTVKTSLMSTYNVGLSQPIYQWGALEKGYQSAQLQRAISARNVAEVRRALATDVRRAYFNLIAAANAREGELQGLVNLEKERDFLKQQAADGFITQNTADYADVRIKDYKLQLRRSDNSWTELWRSFWQMTGIEGVSRLDLPKTIPAVSEYLGPVIGSLAVPVGDSLPSALLNADDSIRVERLNYEIQKKRLWPKLALSLSLVQDNRSPDNNSENPKILTKTYSAMTTVSWNLFDGFNTQALKQGSLIRQRQLKNARDQAERDYQLGLRNSVESLKISWESLLRTEGILNDTRSSAEITQKDFEAGVVPKQALKLQRRDWWGRSKLPVMRGQIIICRS